MVSRILQWAVLAGSYLVLTGSPSGPEYLTAALVSATALWLVLLVRRRGAHRFSLHAPWLAIAGRTLYVLLRDSVVVGAVLVRSLRNGHTGLVVCEADTVDQYAGGTRPERRAVAILQESIAPNTFVLDADRAQLRIHRLG